MRMQSTETNLQVAQERIEDLSSRLEEQEAQKQTHYHNKNLAKILKLEYKYKSESIGNLPIHKLKSALSCMRKVNDLRSSF